MEAIQANMRVAQNPCGIRAESAQNMRIHGPFDWLLGPFWLFRGPFWLFRGPFGLFRGPFGLFRGPFGLFRCLFGLFRVSIWLMYVVMLCTWTSDHYSNWWDDNHTRWGWPFHFLRLSFTPCGVDDHVRWGWLFPLLRLTRVVVDARSFWCLLT